MSAPRVFPSFALTRFKSPAAASLFFFHLLASPFFPSRPGAVGSASAFACPFFSFLRTASGTVSVAENTNVCRSSICDGRRFSVSGGSSSASTAGALPPLPFPPRPSSRPSPPSRSAPSLKIFSVSGVALAAPRGLATRGGIGRASITVASSAKWPRSTIRSASSRTRNCSLPRSAKCSWFRSFMSSQSRPGVATTTSGRRASRRSCFCALIPPTTGTTETSACRATEASISLTCIASSRVGATIRARRALRRRFSRVPASAPERPRSSASAAKGSSSSSLASPPGSPRERFASDGSRGSSFASGSSESDSDASASSSLCVRSRLRIGRPNASVFPDPVSAAPMTSHRPLIAGFRHSRGSASGREPELLKRAEQRG